MVPVSELAETADKLIRNEIATKNEVRGIIGWKPSSDPKADELGNPNIKGNGQTSGAINNMPTEEDAQYENYAPESPANTIIPGG
jgi:hypothetical protein